MADVKLFDKRPYANIPWASVDQALVDSISVHERHQVVVPHTAGRYQGNGSTR
jgi:hypothetical protein